MATVANIACYIASLDLSIVSGTQRDMVATWTRTSGTHFGGYDVRWEYRLPGIDAWVRGDERSQTSAQSSFTAPSNALSVRVRARCTADTYQRETSDGSRVTRRYWDATPWQTASHAFSADVPDTPTVSLELDSTGLGWVATVSNSDQDAKFARIEARRTFGQTQVTDRWERNAGLGFASCDVESRNAARGETVKVRAAVVTAAGVASPWTAWSASVVLTPAAPDQHSSGVSVVRRVVSGDTYLRARWTACEGATCYQVRHAAKKAYFASNPGEVTEEDAVAATHMDVPTTGMATGSERHFQVRAGVGSSGSERWSGWTYLGSARIDAVPDAPTVWLDSTSVTVGSNIVVHWSHNCDGEAEPSASTVQYRVNGGAWTSSVGSIPTSGMAGGDLVEIRVKTANAGGTYGPFSDIASVGVLSVGSVSVVASQGSGNWPLTLAVSAASAGLYAAEAWVTTDDSYTTLDANGNQRTIYAGDTVARKTAIMPTQGSRSVSFGLGDGLFGGIGDATWHVRAMFINATDAEASGQVDLSVPPTDIVAGVAEVDIDEASKSVTLTVAALEADRETIADDATVSVYRVDWDGTCTLLGSKTGKATVTDYRCSLGSQAYRVVVRSAEGEYRASDYTVRTASADGLVLTWGDRMDAGPVFDDDGGGWVPAATSGGGAVVLPYGLSLTESREADADLVSYVGRGNPVAYYGTQHARRHTCTAPVGRFDSDTLDALRRLGDHDGDVLVRDPMGGCFTAHAQVSIRASAGSGTASVSLTFTRTEGSE